MRKKTFRITDPNEAAVLAQVVLRRALPHDLAQCQQEVCENHYLKNTHLVGEQLWCVAELLLERLDLDGTVALMDALNTQVETARSIVQEGGGDFELVVKGNQENVLDQGNCRIRNSLLRLAL